VTIWLDKQLPRVPGSWAREHLGVDCTSVRELALQRASDLVIFHAARAAGALVMTKDTDFAEFVGRFGPPPQVVLVTCGRRRGRLKPERRWQRVPQHCLAESDFWRQAKPSRP
jgi:predicted nuclease of predicted toxin-antitoxin system